MLSNHLKPRHTVNIEELSSIKTRNIKLSLLQWTSCSATSHSSHLKGRPVHGHVDAVVVAPPLQILLVVSIGNSVVELFIDPWQTIMKINVY